MKKSILLIIILAYSFFYFGCKSQAQEKQGKKGVLVKMTTLERTDLKMPIYTTGVLSAKDEVVLSFKTGGVIKNIFVDAGQKVKKGQLLAQLDLAEISSYREQAESGLAKATRDMQRIERLYNESVVTLEQKQNMQTAVDVAKANLKIATFNEKHSSIYAPSAGKILTRFAEMNELTSPGNPILAFGATNEAFVLNVGLSDKDLIKIQIGDSARIHFDAYPGNEFSASVSQISATATPGSGTFQVELQLDISSKILFSGFIGKATIIPQKTEPVILIPIEALMEASEKTGFVFKIDDKNIAQKQEVKILSILNDHVAISKGLENVEKIVTQGNAYLASGSLVTIVD